MSATAGQVGQAFTVRMTLMSAFHSPASRGYAFRMIQAMATPVSVGLDLWEETVRSIMMIA
ncbi:hypothetical protein LDENG_00096610 [Lucifuga dentata]|nr:hypothetical protein LDENG_00096610 [Lucifuga dentata]